MNQKFKLKISFFKYFLRFIFLHFILIHIRNWNRIFDFNPIISILFVYFFSLQNWINKKMALVNLLLVGDLWPLSCWLRIPYISLTLDLN